ncbi:hypothetical protein [Streptomyces sp. NPDC088762]|uniref:hypothetical protein n=1 Tax=Streptomyces sp. NPDC088762 TaxID=3365891 RepID=UPI003812481F
MRGVREPASLFTASARGYMSSHFRHPHRPQLLVLGRHDQDGRLRAVGRTVPLRPEVARLVPEHLAAVDPGRP